VPALQAQSPGFKKKKWVPVAHTCNPGYSGGRDQEDHGKPAWVNCFQDLKKKKSQKGW
jgi:hypothetical protein